MKLIEFFHYPQGNKQCDFCDEVNDRVVELPDWQWICENCIKKALRAITKVETCSMCKKERF